MSAPAMTDFQAIVSHLFKLMKLQGNPTEAKSQGYTVSLNGKLQVELIGVQEGFLNLLSVVGALPGDADGATLRALGCANEFTFDHPPVCLGLDQETGNVTLWTRQALAELDEAAVVSLFERFTGMAELVQHWLAAGGAKQGQADGLRKASTSARLQRLKSGKPEK